MMATSLARTPTTAAAICLCAVVMPLPISDEPQARWYLPSGSSFISAPERCSVGGPHSSMASAAPVPSSQSSPSGFLTPLPFFSSRSTMSRHWSMPWLPKLASLGSFQIDSTLSPGRTTFLRRISNGSMPRILASSSMAHSMAKVVCEAP